MAKVIPFPSARKQANELVDEIISRRMSNKDPEVLECLKVEMTDLVKKYFSGKDLTLSLVLPRDLSDEQFATIEESVKRTIDDNNRLLNQRTNQLFFDLCLSRMAICELRHQLQKD